MSNAEILGLFVWHELMTTDPQGAAAFYSGLFPWIARPSSTPDYLLWMSGSTGVGGLMAQPEETGGTGAPPSWLVYLGTPDVDATAEAAGRLGGKVLKAPTDIPAVGRFAVLSDPQGAAFAVFTPEISSPAGTADSADVARFSWHELATTDPLAALDFYSQLFGWNLGKTHDMGAGNTYQIIECRDTQVGGVYRLQDPSKPAYWLTYVKVEALDEVVSATRASGGRIIQEPHEVPGGDRVARILDPQGGVIALHELPKAAKPAQTQAPRARKAAIRKAAIRKAATRKAATRKAATRKAAIRKAATRKAATRKAATRKAARSQSSAKSAAGGKARHSARPKTKSAAKNPARKLGKRPVTTKKRARKAGKVKTAAKTHSAGIRNRRVKVVRKGAKKTKRKLARRH